MSQKIKIDDIKEFKTVELPDRIKMTCFLVLKDGRFAFANTTELMIYIYDPKNDFHCDIKIDPISDCKEKDPRYVPLKFTQIDEDTIHVFTKFNASIYKLKKDSYEEIVHFGFSIPHDEFTETDGNHDTFIHGIAPLSKRRLACYGNNWFDIRNADIDIMYRGVKNLVFGDCIMNAFQLKGKEKLVVHTNKRINFFDLNTYSCVQTSMIKASNVVQIDDDRLLVQKSGEVFIFNYVTSIKEASFRHFNFNTCEAFQYIGDKQFLCGAINMALLDLETMKFTTKEVEHSQNCRVLKDIGNKTRIRWYYDQPGFTVWKY